MKYGINIYKGSEKNTRTEESPFVNFEYIESWRNGVEVDALRDSKTKNRAA